MRIIDEFGMSIAGIEVNDDLSRTSPTVHLKLAKEGVVYDTRLIVIESRSDNGDTIVDRSANGLINKLNSRYGRDNVVAVRATDNGYEALQGSTEDLRGNVKVQYLGHGKRGSLEGQGSRKLADNLKSLLPTGTDDDPLVLKKVSIAGCKSGNVCNLFRRSLADNLQRNLVKEGHTTVQVKGYKGRIDFNAEGKRIKVKEGGLGKKEDELVRFYDKSMANIKVILANKPEPNAKFEEGEKSRDFSDIGVTESTDMTKLLVRFQKMKGDGMSPKQYGKFSYLLSEKVRAYKAKRVAEGYKNIYKALKSSSKQPFSQYALLETIDALDCGGRCLPLSKLFLAASSDNSIANFVKRFSTVEKGSSDARLVRSGLVYLHGLGVGERNKYVSLTLNEAVDLLDKPDSTGMYLLNAEPHSMAIAKTDEGYHFFDPNTGIATFKTPQKLSKSLNGMLYSRYGTVMGINKGGKIPRVVELDVKKFKESLIPVYVGNKQLSVRVVDMLSEDSLRTVAKEGDSSEPLPAAQINNTVMADNDGVRPGTSRGEEEAIDVRQDGEDVGPNNRLKDIKQRLAKESLGQQLPSEKPKPMIDTENEGDAGTIPEYTLEQEWADKQRAVRMQKNLSKFLSGVDQTISNREQKSSGKQQLFRNNSLPINMRPTRFDQQKSRRADSFSYSISKDDFDSRLKQRARLKERPPVVAEIIPKKIESKIKHDGGYETPLGLRLKLPTRSIYTPEGRALVKKRAREVYDETPKNLKTSTREDEYFRDKHGVSLADGRQLLNYIKYVAEEKGIAIDEHTRIADVVSLEALMREMGAIQDRKTRELFIKAHHKSGVLSDYVEVTKRTDWVGQNISDNRELVNALILEERRNRAAKKNGLDSADPKLASIPENDLPKLTYIEEARIRSKIAIDTCTGNCGEYQRIVMSKLDEKFREHKVQGRTISITMNDKDRPQMNRATLILVMNKDESGILIDHFCK